MTHHDITINLQNGHAVPAIPAAGVIQVGDTVSYSSPDGKVRVVFEDGAGSPFGDRRPDVVHGSETRTFRKVGTFFCKCFITPHEVGWFDGETPQSGGDHDVKP
jgi:hypothetical protein